MAAQRNSVLFLLLLFLSVVFLFSLYNSSLPLSTPSHTSLHSPTIFNPLQNPNPNLPNFTLTIKVLGFDRLSSLSRCLLSLSAADYGSDRVNLHIFIDHFKLPDSTNDISVNLDQKLNESRQILDFVDGFSWGFGEKLVHYRTGNVGLQAQWLEAWWPSSDQEFAFVVEDDLEVSPLYYRFLRGLILNYYYNASNFSPLIYGASLQRPRFVPGKHGNKIQLDSSTHIFLYQLVGTWGQLLFPRPWKEFRLWYDSHKAKGTKPFLQGMVTTGWYKKMGERIWTPWFIQFIHAYGYFNIYTNFLHERALSVSHRDAGVNYGKTAGPDSYLIDNNKPLDFNLLEMHTPLNELKWFDFCFTEVHPNRIVRGFKELESVLLSVQKLDTIILVSLYGSASETLVRNLLCHFERLNIRNYIFVGPNSSFLLDLARRGHPVIDADQFFDSIRAYISTTSMIKEFWVKAFVIKKCLELKYNTWVAGPYMIPVSNDSFLPDSYFDPNTNFYFGEIYKFLFIRSSSSAREIWDNDDFLFNAALAMNNNNNNNYKEAGSSLKGGNFGYTVGKLLEKKGAKKVDEKMLGVNIISSSSSSSISNSSGGRSNVNETSLLLSVGNGKKVAFWSGETGPGLVQKRLEELGLWIVDGDSSCTAVVCHPS